MAAKYPYFIGFLVNQTQLQALEAEAAAQACNHSDVLRAYLEELAARQTPLAPVASGARQHDAHER
jgi:hypothetical protein